MPAKVKSRKVKKATSFPLKPRRLTKAEKAKRTIERNRVTRAKRRGGDPFYIHPYDVPVGRAYQWFSVDQAATLEMAKEDGWKDVPFSRHDFARKCRLRGGITVRGLRLMEHSESHVKERRDEEQAAARQMYRDSPVGAAMNLPFGDKFKFFSEHIVSQDYQAVPHDAPPIEVDVTLKFRMHRNWQDAAAYLHLTNEEYVRRRLLMTSPLMHRADGDACYEAVYIKLGSE